MMPLAMAAKTWSQGGGVSVSVRGCRRQEKGCRDEGSGTCLSRAEPSENTEQPERYMEHSITRIMPVLLGPLALASS